MPLLPLGRAVTIPVGPLIDDTDFKTLETAVAHDAAGMNMDLMQTALEGDTTKTDLTPTTGGTQDWTHRAQGWYDQEVTAAQNNVLGRLWLAGFVTGVLPFWSDMYQVVPADVYDAVSSPSVDHVLNRTTIATLASQTSFTLTAGSADNSAYPLGSTVVVQDATTAAQIAVGYLSAYTGSSRTVTLLSDPAIFTMAVGDKVTIIAPIGANVELWKRATAPAMTGDAFARLGAPAGASTAADIAAVKAETVLLLNPAGFKRNTAFTAFPFKMVLASDHVTPATGKTVTAERMLDGATFAACANAVVEDSAGWYHIDLATTDLNGVAVVLKFTAADCDQTDFAIITEP